MYIVLFQAESVKAIRRDGKWRDLSGGVKNEGGLGWRVKKRVGSESSCLHFLFVAPLLLSCRLFISLHFTD